MFNSLLSFFFAFVLAISYFARAAPVQPVENIAFRPTITYPTAGAVWYTGSMQKASWKTDNLPTELQNAKGLLLLGYQTDDSENLDIRKCGEYPHHRPVLISLKTIHLLPSSPSARVPLNL